MDLGDGITLLNYKARNTFFDWCSSEKSSGREKGKFKLLFKHNKALDLYVFYSLHSKSDVCVRDRTFSIHKNDWEHREEKCLTADYSFTDIQSHAEVLEKIEVLKKAKEPKTGLSFSGTLSRTKYIALEDKIKNYTSSMDLKTDATKRDYLKMITFDELTTETYPADFITRFNI